VELPVPCDRCAHRCVLPPDTAGRCGAVSNRDGAPAERWAGLLSHCQLDAVETRPLFHFAPGSKVLVVGCYGCSFTCPYCQNHAAAFGRPPDDLKPVSPAEVVRRAVEAGVSGLSAGVTEPLVLRDYFSSAWAGAHDAGLFNVVVTNGYATPQTAARLSPLLDAAVVGFKGFSNRIYRRYCGGSIEPVLRTVEEWSRAGVHLELTYLLVPGVSTTGGQPLEFAEWAVGVDAGMPVHFVACQPAHLWLEHRAPSTATVDAAVSAARRAGLRFAYGHGGSESELNTTCPDCGALLVGRRARRDACPSGELNRWCTSYDVDVRADHGRCPACGARVSFVQPEYRV